MPIPNNVEHQYLPDGTVTYKWFTPWDAYSAPGEGDYTWSPTKPAGAGSYMVPASTTSEWMSLKDGLQIGGMYLATPAIGAALTAATAGAAGGAAAAEGAGVLTGAEGQAELLGGGEVDFGNEAFNDLGNEFGVQGTTPTGAQSPYVGDIPTDPYAGGMVDPAYPATTTTGGTPFPKTVNIGGYEIPISLLGSLGGSAIGAFGAANQSSQLSDLAQQYAGYGAPYRDQLAKISADPSQYYNGPIAQGALGGVLNKLSVNGNPFGNATSLGIASQAAMGGYGAERDRLAGYGGLTNYAAAAPNLDAAAINAGSGVWNAVGSGIADATNPRLSLPDILKGMKSLNMGVA